MLFIHWKQTRLLLLPFVVAAFGLPLLAIQGLGPSTAEDSFATAYEAVAGLSLWLPLFPLLAGAIGVTLGITAWNWDHRLGHVYALSLPVARWEYAMLKMGAGVVLAVVPTVALWIGAHVAAASVTLPVGLNAYPNHLALRFFLATVLSYALLFAMAAGTIKTTVWVASGAIGLFVFAGLFQEAIQLAFPTLGFDQIGFVDVLADWLVRAGGPFAVFNGNWALIDV
jgi:hypothetical protein